MAGKAQRDQRAVREGVRPSIIPGSSWPGFGPAIHVFLPGRTKDVDARHKAGHDESGDASHRRI
jgi:hypothetical protein